MNPIPFTTIDAAFALGFQIGLNSTLAKIMAWISGPLVVCVTLWIIVQGMLVMRGELDLRKGLGKIVKHALVVALVTSSSAYNDYVQETFVRIVPDMAKSMAGGPTTWVGVPVALDALLAITQVAFHTVAAQIGTMNTVDAESFSGAQAVMHLALLTSFGLYEIATIMTSILVAVGPLMLVGYLFESTKGVAERWLGQLINYGILLLLFHVGASIVLLTETALIVAQAALIAVGGSVAAQIVGLYELAMIVVIGDVIIASLPVAAAALGGGIIGPSPATGSLGQHAMHARTVSPRRA